MLRLMNTRFLLATGTLLSAALGCRDDAESPAEPAPIPALANMSEPVALAFSQVSAGGGHLWLTHTCGVTTDNRVYCWGSNDHGQLGVGTSTGPESCADPNPYIPACSTRPITVLGGLRFRQVSAGWTHTCGVTIDYRAYCWGGNSGQLGDGTTTGRLRPVAVSGDLKFRQVTAGFLHTCGVSYPDERPYCWGLNVSAQLGDGTTTQRLSPVAVAGGHRFRHVSAGQFHTCGVTTSGMAFCWGSNDEGQLGDSSTVGRRLRPSRVAGTRQFRQVDAGERHTCAVTISSRAFCWGDGRSGQLGNGKRNLSFWPRAVSGGISFDRVTAGGSHSCGETIANRAYCWGFGTLGDGTDLSHLTPVAVAGGLTFSQVTAGNGSTCGKTQQASLYCWGHNGSGNLGDGTTDERTTPTPVAGLI